MKKLSYIILSLFIAFAPAYAYATTSTGGWTLTDSLIAGANTTIEAAKTAGGKAVKSTAVVGASAAKVGKHLIKGGGQAALAYAVVELLGEGIDWVLDPANNAVRYTDPADENSSAHQYLAVYKKNSDFLYPFTASTREAAALGNCLASGNVFSHMNSNTSFTCNTVKGAWAYNGTISLNPSYDPDAPSEEYKYLPIDTVAAKVISNAEAGHAPSQEAVKATALEGFAAGDFDASLDASAVDATDTDTPVDPDAPTDPNAPPVPPPAFELPAFCSWAAPVCAFATWAQQEWSEFVLTITALKDWLFEEPAPNDADNTIDPTPVPITPVQVAIDFVGSCPAPLTFEYKIYNQTFNPSVPFTPMCEVAIMINPVIKICASIAAIYIVAGIRQGNS